MPHDVNDASGRVQWLVDAEEGKKIRIKSEYSQQKKRTKWNGQRKRRKEKGYWSTEIHNWFAIKQTFKCSEASINFLDRLKSCGCKHGFFKKKFIVPLSIKAFCSFLTDFILELLPSIKRNINFNIVINTWALLIWWWPLRQGAAPLPGGRSKADWSW